MIKFRCPHCDQKLGVPDEYAGRRVRCSKCSQSSAVPRPQAASAPSTGAALQQTAGSATLPAASAGQTTAQRIQLQTRIAPPEPLDELECEQQPAPQGSLMTEDPREQAIRLARQQRTKEHQASAKSAKAGSNPKNTSRTRQGFGFSLSEMVPETLRGPIGLVLAVICMAVAVGGWVVAARATSCALCFVALFIPLAAVSGIKLVTVNGGFLQGAAAALLGGLGIAAGKAAIAQYVVIPYQQNYAQQEVLTDMPKLLADERYQLGDGQSVKSIARDGDFMMCIALFSLVDDGQADPVTARRWAFDILRASNKTNVYAMALTALNAAPEAPRLPEPSPEDEPLFEMAYARMFQWEESETELTFARKYFPALNCIASQCETARLLQNPDTAFKFAILSTLGLFDVFWVLLGMGLAYISLCLD